MKATDIPRLPRGVRTRFDDVRGVWVLLAPERVLMLDEIGLAILNEVDGARDFGTITATLAARYDAPADRIAADAARFLGGLRNRRFLDVSVPA
jgi:pyrroloquinoline quinone biosynthesis protein D